MCECRIEKKVDYREEAKIPSKKCVRQIDDDQKDNILQKKIFDCKSRNATKLLKSEPTLLLCNENGQLSDECSCDATGMLYKSEDSLRFEFLKSEEKVEPHGSSIIYELHKVGNEDEEKEPDVECTLAIIKPDGVNHRKEIERSVYEEGIEVYQRRRLQLTPEQASEFYYDCYGQTNYAHLVASMTSKPIDVMVLAKHKAVHDWKTLIEPTKVCEASSYCPDSIRAQFGRRGEEFENAVHGSENRHQAEKEIHFFFPEIILEPILKGEMAVEYLWESINSVLIEGLSMCCRVKPADPVLWLANWFLTNNPRKPKMSKELSLIPT